jgi:hypothetical protein
MSTKPKKAAQVFSAELDGVDDDHWRPSWNIPPLSRILAVREEVDEHGELHRLLGPFKWGLVPAWAKDPKVGSRAFNARSAPAVASEPAWTGRWFSPKGDRWFRVWACPEHLEELTGLRQFGGSRPRFIDLESAEQQSEAGSPLGQKGRDMAESVTSGTYSRRTGRTCAELAAIHEQCAEYGADSNNIGQNGYMVSMAQLHATLAVNYRLRMLAGDA